MISNQQWQKFQNDLNGHWPKKTLPPLYKVLTSPSPSIENWNPLQSNDFYKKIQISKNSIKGTVMQIEKALINDRLNVSRVSWKFHIPTIYNFAAIYMWNLLFSLKKSLLFNGFYCLFSLSIKHSSSIT